MGLSAASIFSFATRALGAIASGVPAMQAARTAFRAGSGADKKAAVMDLVKAELAAAELATGRDLANDADVIAAAGTVIDAAAAFHKVVSHKALWPTP